MTGAAPPVSVRPTRPEDSPAIAAITEAVYPGRPPWSERELASHRAVFPEGQFVAVDARTGAVLGMAASLVVRWDEYDLRGNWEDFTAGGTFANHDPGGRTLYGAEAMVRPDAQGRGVGTALYLARQRLALRLCMLRIRAGARLCGYHRHADRMDARGYAERVVRGQIADPTLTF